MLDEFVIFSRRGLVVWKKTDSRVKGDPVDDLIRTVLLEERAGKSHHTCASYALKWALDNERQLVYVAIYQKSLTLAYVDELLARVPKAFVNYFEEGGGSSAWPEIEARALSGTVDFGARYRKALVAANQAKARRRAQKKQRGFEETERGREFLAAKEERGELVDVAPKKSKKSTPEVDSEEEEEDGEEEGGDGPVDLSTMTPEQVRELLRKKRAAKKRGKASPARKPRKAKSGDADGAKSPAKKKGKEKRRWAGAKSKISQADMAELDMSASKGKRSGGGDDDDAYEATNDADFGRTEMDEQEEEEDSSDDDDGEGGGGGKGWFGSVGGFFQQITGNKTLERADLAPVLKQMTELLTGKNVALEVAQQIVESVAQQLEGQKLGSFTRVKTAVRKAVEEAVERILTPKKSIDVLREALTAKRKGKPYVVVFVGVNGVGKSTSLSKVCYYLQQKKLNVLIAACDTFRSGAVEQLKTHARRLKVEVFERGYAKDPAGVARSAVEYAAANKKDVVLVDTAGRMQNNEPLMRALTKLVTVNNPDLVLFVGEALVGNDGVDQLYHFNKCLADLSTLNRPRLIDGIILSKFDTVDDKVGAAVSMVHKTGQPVVFVGTGQKYTHLRRLNVRTVVKTLFS